MMKNSLENVDTWFGLAKAGVVELAVGGQQPQVSRMLAGDVAPQTLDVIGGPGQQVDARRPGFWFQDLFTRGVGAVAELSTWIQKDG